MTPRVFWGRAVSVKKAKGKGKRTAKKSSGNSAKKSAEESAEKSEPQTKKPVDLAQVRENINNLVGESAEEIARIVIEGAKTGQLTSAKYLFEAVGLYPSTEPTAARPIEISLAHTLLRRMGLPLDPVVCDEDPAPAVLPSEAQGRSAEIPEPSAGEEDREGERKEATRPTRAESEE
jgi:hypothetical protein